MRSVDPKSYGPIAKIIFVLAALVTIATGLFAAGKYIYVQSSSTTRAEIEARANLLANQLEKLSRDPNGKISPEIAERLATLIRKVSRTAKGDESAGDIDAIAAIARELQQLRTASRKLNFAVDQSPYILKKNSTVMVCNKTVSIGYTRDNANGSKRFLINGSIWTSTPGNIYRVANATLTYMKAVPEESAVIVDFRCPK